MTQQQVGSGGRRREEEERVEIDEDKTESMVQDRTSLMQKGISRFFVAIFLARLPIQATSVVFLRYSIERCFTHGFQ